MTLSQDHHLLDLLPTAVYTTDAAGRITYYNPAAAKLWGRAPKVGELWCGSWRIYKPNGEPLPHDACPMAVALKEGREVRGVEAVVERPDGTRVPFMPFPSPIRDDESNVMGAINLLVDLTDIHAAEIEKARLAAIVESSDDAIISKTLRGVVTTWNASAERIFGYAAKEMIGQPVLKLIPPELHHEEDRILGEIAAGRRVDHYETVRLTKDGQLIQISLSVSPVRNSSGEIIGAAKVARDISERKRAEQVQRLLMDELNHRVKNTLATVDAISRQTLRRAGSAKEFADNFSGRLKALARANALLTPASVQGGAVGHGAEISELIVSQLSLGEDGDPRIHWKGPVVALTAQASLHLALIVHELGTNARKYGALSSPTGRVAIKWAVESHDDTRLLTLTWHEAGGPQVTAPQKRGFGTTLIEQSLKSHGGLVRMTFAASGVSCEIELPLTPIDELAPTSRDVKEAASAILPGNPVLSGKRVLVVEDEALIAMVAVDFLAEAGCEIVGPAPTIEAALELIEKCEVDAALLDGNLLGRRVDAVALALTQKNIPFAFVTGYGRDALPAGFRDAATVEKPFSQDQLVSALNQILTGGAAKVIGFRKRR
jgi:PAS domain S-box-containing protein